MQVNWAKVNIGAVRDSIKPHILKGDTVLESIVGKAIDEESALVDIPGYASAVKFSMPMVLGPLMSSYNFMREAGQGSDFLDLVRKAWNKDEDGAPKFYFDVLDTKQPDSVPTVVSMKRTTSNRKPQMPTDVLSQLNWGVCDEVFDHTRIGYDGASLELQMLDGRPKLEVRPGDIVDAGIFISVTSTGKVSASVGCNRLVCSNGLTRNMRAFSSKELSMIIKKEFYEDAKKFVQWFGTTANKKVTSIRELKITLQKQVPESYQKLFIEDWAKRIELKELTYFDVIDNITREASKNLSGSRYKAIAIGGALEADGGVCRCPTCSSKIEEKV